MNAIRRITGLLASIGFIAGCLMDDNAVATTIPAAIYIGDAYPGSHLLPACIGAPGSCAQLRAPGTDLDSSISPDGFSSSMAEATMSGSPFIPEVTAHANAGNDASVASAQILYYMEITGGAGTSPVTLDVSASGSASASGGGAAGGGAFEIQDNTTNAVLGDWTTCASTIFPGACDGVGTTFNLVGQPLTLNSNTLYAVLISATASVGGCPGFISCPLQTGDAQAAVDPSFVIDPSTPDLSQYSLNFSAGIENTAPTPSSVSEPATCTLLVMAIAMLAASRARPRS